MRHGKHNFRGNLRTVPLLILLLMLFCLLPTSTLRAQDLPVPRIPVGYARCHEINHLLHWRQFPIRVYFSPGFYALTLRRAQALAGFDEWVQATQGVVCYRIVSDKSTAQLTVTSEDQLFLPQEARAVGQTVLTYTGTELTRALIQLVICDDDPARFQEISAHEFGHALGIDGHSEDDRDMMFPVLSHSLFQVTNPELDAFCRPGTVTPRDVETLQAAYPMLNFTPKKP